MHRADTERKLSIVTLRNEGRRQSLVLDEDFPLASSSSDTSSSVEEDTGTGHESAQSLDLDKLSELKESTANDGSIEKRRQVSKHTSSRSQSSIDLSHVKVSQTIKEIDRMNSGIRLRKKRGTRTGKKGSPGAEPAADFDVQDQVEEMLRSKFSDIEFYTTSTTIFDAEYFKNSEFFGLYILFWLGTGFLMLSNLVQSYFESNLPFYERPVAKTLGKDVLKIGVTDLGMYLTSYGVYIIQWACLKEYLQWNSSGKVIHVLFEFGHFLSWLKYAEYAEFHWIGKVFLCLHGIVFLMKMHSYGFYNGYLWNILDELVFSESYLERLEANDGSTTLPPGYEIESVKKTLRHSIIFCKFELEFQSKPSVLADNSGPGSYTPSVLENMDREDLKVNVEFPSNITLFNFFEFSNYPVVVYTLHFTRTKKIRWAYVAEKVIGIFGIIFLMLLVADNMMYPLVLRAIKAREELPVPERIVQYCFILLDMMPPFLMEYLFTFFLIWDSILNAIAELSRFADRDFYGPWWSCTDWAEFARIWNRPVHKFLLRHVYHSSLSTLNLNKGQSSLFTFIISSVVHELVMYVIFRRLRGYLLLLQMSQLPLIMIGNTKFMKGKKVLGNVICWVGFISGPSLICTAYLMF
ncbi:sterol O-acyltransferase 2 [[Candida] railenensis]|uniref:O-acyltransferase n=1 Tax=[Candida] railenensis TaxID=45579 RepID=A0A9P0VX28_9ASCO|nr:sterol O-acyltransferase 2 [[Candida] railenensis]